MVTLTKLGNKKDLAVLAHANTGVSLCSCGCGGGRVAAALLCCCGPLYHEQRQHALEHAGCAHRC
eukprot:4282365-Amphidinium_carterae.1